MLINVLVFLNIVVNLAFAGLLLYLCFRTRSKGLIFITAILITRRILSSSLESVFQAYIDQWVGGEVRNWLTERMTLGEFMITVSLINSVIFVFLCLLGIFLMYREWRLGKFGYPPLKHQKKFNA